jgi:hypothetical protein
VKTPYLTTVETFLLFGQCGPQRCKPVKKGVFHVFFLPQIAYIGSTKLNKMADQPSPGNIKDELFLISFLVIASGLIYVDAYYQRFGIRFQSLDFNATYILYKGLIMVTSYPIILLPYFFTVIILFFNLFAAGAVPRWLVSSRMFFLYVLIFADLLLLFPLARGAGQSQATADMRSTTSLPKILVLKTATEDFSQPKSNFVLFQIDKDFIYMFEPSASPESQTPILFRIPKSDIKQFKTQL